MQDTPLFFVKNWIYLVGVLLVFLTSFYGCGRTSGQQSPELGALHDDGGFFTTLPEPLHKNRSGLTAEVQIIKDDGTVDRIELLFIDPDTHQVSGRIDGLSTGTYIFTIRYRLNGVLVATETTTGLVNQNATTPIAFVSLTFPDNDNDGVNNLEELGYGTNPNIPLAEVSVVSAGSNHTCAIKKNGSLWCWGNNGSGQLGDSTTNSRLRPVQENTTARDWFVVSAGWDHTCAIKKNRSVWCWGSNFRGQLGDGSVVKKLVPVQENSAATDWATLSAGPDYTCAVKTNGSLWCWGDNFRGQLGDNSTVEKLVPTQENSDTLDWATVSAGFRHTCAVKTNASLWCWGNNSNGQLGDNTSDSKWVPTQENSTATNWITVAAGESHTCAVKTNGSLWCWGDNFRGQLGDNTSGGKWVPTQENSTATNWITVAAGERHTCATKENGSLWCWGNNESGQLGDGSTENKRVPIQENSGIINLVTVSTGRRYTCAIKSNDSLWCWGNNTNGQLGNKVMGNKQVPTQENNADTDWAMVSTGERYTCAIKTNGSLWCWGGDFNGQLGNNTNDNKQIPTQEDSLAIDWTSISAGSGYACAIKVNGSLWCWGLNSGGQLGDDTTVQKRVPTQENSAATDWVVVSSGGSHTCAIKINGSLWCWGENSNGQLGDNTNDNKQIPTQEDSLAIDWVGVSANNSRTCAIKANGSLWCWGENSNGGLGDNSLDDKWSPTQENSRSTDWSVVSGGGFHSCGRKFDNSLWCWGDNFSGQLGDGTQDGRRVPTQENNAAIDWATVSAGALHTCAIKTNASLWCWGINDTGLLGDSSTVNRQIPTQENSAATDWVVVSSGGSHTCAIKTNGSLWCWGWNYWGQLGDGQAWSSVSQPVHLE